MHVCAYDSAHRVREDRLVLHYTKVHFREKKPTCPFNMIHVFDTTEDVKAHMHICPQGPVNAAYDIGLSPTKIKYHYECSKSSVEDSASYLADIETSSVTTQDTMQQTSDPIEKLMMDCVAQLKSEVMTRAEDITIDGCDISPLRSTIMRSAIKDELLPLFNFLIMRLSNEQEEQKRKTILEAKVSQPQFNTSSDKTSLRPVPINNNSKLREPVQFSNTDRKPQPVSIRSPLNVAMKQKTEQVMETLKNSLYKRDDPPDILSECDSKSIYSDYDENDELKNAKLYERAKQLQKLKCPQLSFPSLSSYTRRNLDEDGLSVVSSDSFETAVQ